MVRFDDILAILLPLFDFGYLVAFGAKLGGGINYIQRIS